MKKLIESQVLKILKESTDYNAWVMPSEDKLKLEFKIEHTFKGNDFWEDESDFLNAINSAKIEVITPDKDRKIRYRSRTQSFDDLHDLISTYGSYPEYRNESTLKNLYKRMGNNEELDYPIVVEFANGIRRVFSGNTRMDVAFQMGINPQVLVVQSETNY